MGISLSNQEKESEWVGSGLLRAASSNPDEQMEGYRRDGQESFKVQPINGQLTEKRMQESLV